MKLSIVIIVSAIFALAISCSKNDGSSNNSSTTSSGFKAPAVAPVVNAALPTAYQATNTTVSASSVKVKRGTPGATYHAQYRALAQKIDAAAGVNTDRVFPMSSVVVTGTNGSVAATNIALLFSTSFPDINQGTVSWQGYINSQIIQIDERMDSGPPTAPMACLAGTANQYVVDLSGIDPMLRFPLLQLQCYGTMGGDATGNNGGMAWGQQGTSCDTVAVNPTPSASGTPMPKTTPEPFNPGSTTGGCNFSLWVSLANDFKNSGGFMTFANLQNAGSTNSAEPEYVDALAISYAPNLGGTTTITRLRAVPSLNTFEMYLGSNQAGIANAELGAGFRMISDGVHIYSDGKVYSGGAWLPYNVCLNAADNSVANIANATILAECNALANSFSLSSTGAADLTYYEITGTSSPSVIPGPVAQSSQTAPSATVANLISAAFPVTNAASAATNGFSSNQ